MEEYRYLHLNVSKMLQYTIARNELWIHWEQAVLSPRTRGQVNFSPGDTPVRTCLQCCHLVANDRSVTWWEANLPPWFQGSQNCLFSITKFSVKSVQEMFLLNTGYKSSATMLAKYLSTGKIVKSFTAINIKSIQIWFILVYYKIPYPASYQYKYH